MNIIEAPQAKTEIQPTNPHSRLVAFFISNSYLAILAILTLVIGGVLTAGQLKTQGFPSPTINVAIITDVYRGASAAQMESLVIKPLEASIGGVKGLGDVQSSARDGFASVQANFDAGSDVNAGLSELRSRVASAEIAKDAERAQVTSPDFGGSTSYYAVTGQDTPAHLRDAGEAVRVKLESVPGIKSFKLNSNLKDQVEVRWNSEALQQRGLTPASLVQAIGAGNVALPAGSVTSDGVEKTVVTLDQLTSADSIRMLVIGQDVRTKTPVTVGDVAVVVQTVATSDLFQRIGYRNGIAEPLNVQPSIVYQLNFKEDTDILKTDKAVKGALSDLQDGWSHGNVQIVPVLDSAKSTQSQVNEIVSGAIGGKIGTSPYAGFGYLLGGIWLVLLAMLVFVSWRAGLIAASAIPLSLLFTFIALKVQHTDLNTLTLFSMVLVLGLIVDPAIVVLESIQRELDLGLRGTRAIIAAMNEVGSGVFMAALTSIIVFVPFGVVSGIFGQIIKYIPITVIPALIASYLIPLLFLTYLARQFLRPSKRAKDGDELGNLWAAGRWFIRANTWILHRFWAQFLVVLVLVFLLPGGIAGYLFSHGKIHQTQFSSPPDNENLIVSIEYPSNMANEQKIALVSQIEPIMASVPEISRFFVQIQEPGSTTLQITLLPKIDRTRLSPAVINDLNARLKELQKPDERVYLTASSENAGPPTNDFPVSINITGNDLDALKAAAIKSGDILRARPEVIRVDDGFTNVNSPQLEVRLDPDKLKAKGLSGIQVAQIVGGSTGQPSLVKFSQTLDGTERTVEALLVNTQAPTTASTLSTLAIAPGITVEDVGSVVENQGLAGINRLNGQRFVTVKAKVMDALKDAAPAQKAVTDYWTPDRLQAAGLAKDALQDKGSNAQFIKSFQDLFIAIGIAILLSYIVFVLYFRSFSQPLIILASIPLSLIGVLPALAAIGGQFGFLEILGVITLIGIVENVGIFLIDLANRKRREGEPKIQAISEATGIRLRPIFLTKVTALGGLLPLIILSPFWRSLSLVVVAGILTSGVLSLFVTPVLYSWFLSLKKTIFGILGRTLPNQ